ncbi:RNA polymerase sigma factor [Verrucomicrobiota bacterium]
MDHSSNIAVSDETLMRQFCETLDENVFKELSLRYYASAIRIAQTYVKNETLAQDIVQETFIRIIRKRKKYKPEKSFRPWFYAILRNTCINMIRKESRYSAMLHKFSESIQGNMSPTIRAKHIVSEIMTILAPDERDLLTLRYIHGYSFAEIAAHFDCSIDAAKKRSQRIMQKLKSR